MSGRIAVGCVGAPKLESAWSTVAVAGVYASIIGTAEVLAAFVSPVAAAAIHSVVLVALLTHYLVRPERVFAALALVPLLRLSSLALATEHPLAFYVLAGVPVLLGAVLAADALDLPGALRLWEIRHRSQWHAAVSAFAVAGVGASLIRLEPVTHDRSVAALLFASAVVFVFAGVLEELVFRGVIQGALDPLLGGWSAVVANVLFVATYLGSGSGLYVVFMGAFGSACGWWVRRTGSVAGAAIGHGLLAAGLLVIWPVVL